MTEQNVFHQDPLPGSRRVLFRGDTVRFTLEVPHAGPGRAWVRTNIGHAAIARRAVIDGVDQNTPPLGRDWFDIPLRPIAPDRFGILLPLSEVGHFEAKCFFLPSGEKKPQWPSGENVSVNVQPANACTANIVYNAFVRQFGLNKDGRHFPIDADMECIRTLDRKHYTVIPPSGTFRDLIAQLDFILGTLGCRFVHLLPVSPTPTTYGRMGRFGSPYAALHFTGIDPALAVFDFKATPLDQFVELADAVHARHAGLIIDIAVNHTGWAASLHETHPHWLIRDVEGGISSPGAWGVVWKDLTSLDYSQKDLWSYIARVFLTWCRRGVDGFRCDAGYMIPLPAWSYILARVREEFPETLFFLEGLGGDVSVTRNLLNLANFNWAYSELFQNDDRWQIEHYLPQAIDLSEKDGLAVHYAETHDNNRLAARSKTYARMRTALCALFSSCGGFGFANGVEWFADKKIVVHEAQPLNWGNPVNQIEDIRRLNLLLRFHPAFWDDVELKLITRGGGNHVVLRRLHRPSDKKLIIVVNLDDKHPAEAAWEGEPGMTDASFIDLLTGKEAPVTVEGHIRRCRLSRGQVLCLTADKSDLALLGQPDDRSLLSGRLLAQKKRAKVLEVLCRDRGIRDISDIDPADAEQKLTADPAAFCRRFGSESIERRVVFWQWPTDLHRKVMVPAGHFLLVKAPDPFYAAVAEGYEENERLLAGDQSLPADDGSFFVIFATEAPAAAATRTLKLTVYESAGSRHEKAPVLYLGDEAAVRCPALVLRKDLVGGDYLFLSTNGRGGMCRADIRWGRLNSKYDALLAANLHAELPEDRRVMFTQCRGWIVYQGYSQEVCLDSLESFQKVGREGIWHFKIPTGQGESIQLQISLEMLCGENAVRLRFQRRKGNGKEGALDDEEPVRLILRPDIDDRNFHDVTKAYRGAENVWPANVHNESSGFVFSPSPGRRLRLAIDKGTFVREPEWQYMVSLPADEERGMDPYSDLWSPGYFSSFLQGGEAVILTACVHPPGPIRPMSVPDAGEVAGAEPVFLEAVLKNALSDFIVKRGALKSVIAGYPWFLDWGRDSLIFVRGLVAAGMTQEAKDILRLFAGWEEQGTLPNMICGGQTSNRVTADAPLWFVVACADVIRREKDTAFLSERHNGRALKDILLSIGHAYRAGTVSGVRMDPSSALIYSPACFSWMDTNHPACSPREGYCIEIQALWYASLVFLSAIDSGGRNDWPALADVVAKSVRNLFEMKKGYLADCLSAGAHTKAIEGTLDDALRPNQLLAVTLGLVADKSLGENILEACQRLLIPGAIRSLADAPTDYPQRIFHAGSLLGDPHHPYRGHYQGNEDTCRKPAYHNGTAWTWLFPAYCEAYAIVYGEAGRKTARSLLTSTLEMTFRGCVGHIPEILDGDFPHAHRGCDAQAWGVSEWLRVWELLKMNRKA